MKLLERAISTVAPHECLGCGREGKLICSMCIWDVIKVIPSRCFICHSATLDYAVCDKCRRKTPLKHVWVVSEYDGLAKNLIHYFKFERAQSGAEIIAELLFASLPFTQINLIVPIPTASSRVRLRGYDHTKLIARELSSKMNAPYELVLARTGQTRQVGAKRGERAKQLEGAFRVKSLNSVIKQEILLLDDVTTTGATLNEATKTLKKAGAKRFNAVVFAQTR